MDTYEKKYNEALKRAKKLYEQGTITESLSYVFPELAESENEMIRKVLLDFLKNELKKHGDEEWDGCFHTTDMIAWLEKQGEQKPANNIEPIFNVGDKIQYLKGCGTIMTIEKIENGEYVFANNMGHTTIESGNKWYLVEQKPAWSEEDEKMLNLFLHKLEVCDLLSNKEIIWIKNKLKSLKERVQPKQEWSEEDSKRLQRIIDFLWYNRKGDTDTIYQQEQDIAWLKSLRPQNSVTDEELARAKKEAYNDALNKIEYHSGEPTFDDGWSAAIWYLKKKNAQPQNTWKPSEVQMKALRSAIHSYGTHCGSDPLYHVVLTLEKDLRAL